MRISRDTPSAALASMHTHEAGLSAREAAARLRRFGPNAVARDERLRWWRHAWQCFNNPFNLLLLALAVLAALASDVRATIVIGSMVLLSTALRFIQEGRANRAAEGLQAMVRNTTTVLRRQAAGPGGDGGGDGAAQLTVRLDLPIDRLVPGDLVSLSAGDMIPADCRLLESRDLFIAQAALTGEALPVGKAADRLGEGEAPLEQPNLVFMGSNVVSGTATALVVMTGARTVFGGIALRVAAGIETAGAFQAGLNGVSRLLIRFAMVMVPVVFLISGWSRGDWVSAFLFALSVAVGLTPEMLPMIVTTSLAKGALDMAARKVVIKRLDAIQVLGAMDVLCTDKTGTLTQDRVVLGRHLDPWGRESSEVLRLAHLNSFYQTGLRNLLDRAVLEHASLAKAFELDRRYLKLDELPFDFVRRRMSVVVADDQDRRMLICKGAVEEVLACCTHLAPGDSTTAAPNRIDATELDAVRARVNELSTQGLRVVALATREVSASQTVFGKADEQDLTLIGFIAFLDPPRESAAPALEALARHGIQVKVLTGDNEQVAASVCALVGLGSASILTGPSIDLMDDQALAASLDAHQVFARLNPMHKERLVRALRAQGHTVGFLGDGINDAPALRAADVGISVDSAVDIAREAADVILLEKSLMVLDAGVIAGRNTFCNMLKYIRMTASSNFGNVLSVVIASAFLPFVPMLPLQLLVQNLLYDLSQTAIPFDRVEPDLVAQPLRWNPADIGRFMLWFGPVSSVFDLLTFWMMWSAFGANTVASQGLFQSGWFVLGLLTQVLVVHMVRSPGVPLLTSRASWPLLLTSLAVSAIGIWLPLGPLAADFRLVALPADYFVGLAALLLGYMALATLVKRLYVRRFGWH